MSGRRWVLVSFAFGLLILAMSTPQFAGAKDKPDKKMPKEQDGPSEPTGPIVYPEEGEDPVIQNHTTCTLASYKPDLIDGSVRAFGEQTCNIANQQFITVCLYNSRWYGWQQIGCKDFQANAGHVSATYWGCKRGTYDYQTWADSAFTDQEGIVDAPGIAKSNVLAGISLHGSNCVP